MAVEYSWQASHDPDHGYLWVVLCGTWEVATCQRKAQKFSPHMGRSLAGAVIFIDNLGKGSITMAVENDLVLIHQEDQPVLFARIEEILPDNKPDWYHVKLLMLQVPPQVVTWILRDVYIDGEEFTMNSQRMRLEKVISPAEETASPEPVAPPSSRTRSGGGKVISLKDLKK